MREPRIVVITGAGKGIGAHLARHFAARGDRVIGCSRGDFEGEPFDGYQHVRCDVTSEEDVVELIGGIRSEFGRLDICLNNAGVASMNHVLLTPLESVRRVLDTNLVGTFLVAREAAKLMRKSGGRIVNFTTVAVPLELEGEAVYAASKAGIEQFTRILARELGSFGITVNAVGPNPVETDLTRSVPEDKIQGILDRQAIPRRGECEDVANVVDFFCDERSDLITGQVIYLGGVS